MRKTRIVSARVDRDLVRVVEADHIPLTRIIEAGLGYYSKLSVDEKKRFLLDNTPGIYSNEIAQSILENIDEIPLVIVAGWLSKAPRD